MEHKNLYNIYLLLKENSYGAIFEVALHQCCVNGTYYSGRRIQASP